MLRSLTFASLLLTLACNDPGATTPAKQAEPFVPLLSLRPVAVRLVTGGTQLFQAEINYQKDVRYIRQPVGWRVVEAQGGTVNAAGLYTAPTTPGTYHVQARREDFPDITAIVTIEVK
jgi:hypothetical protein